MLNKHENQVAVIIGGSSGIGLAMAKRLVNEGAYVFITGRRQKKLDLAVKEIGKNVTAIRGNVCHLNVLNRVYETIAREKGILNIVVISTTFVPYRPTDPAISGQMDKIFNINFRTVFFTVQKALPLMYKGGEIFHIYTGIHLKVSRTGKNCSATEITIHST